MKPKSTINPDYTAFVADLKARILSARVSAARAVNRDLILLYWDIGRAILEKQAVHGWGDSIVETLSKYLQKAFPGTQGFSIANLWRMRQFYETHTTPEFLAQAVREIKPTIGSGGQTEFLAQAVREMASNVPWGHHVVLLAKMKDPAPYFYYFRATARFGWSRSVLLNQIKAKAYERSLAEGKTHNFPAVLPEYLAEQAEEALKSSYNLEFLGIRKEVKERELEDRLIERVQQFILELGYGFCFIGRQYRLTLGKMDFYLNLLNEKEKARDDRPSIGIILCAEKDNVEVEFSLKSKANPIGVAEYHLVTKLPKELKGKLPSKRQLLAAVKEAITEKT